jgi:hypothetical protein
MRFRRGAALACLAAFLLQLPAGVAWAAASGTGVGPQRLPAARPGLESSDPQPEALDVRPGSRRITWGIVGSSVGLVGGVGLALWVKNQADDRYDRYLHTADPERAQDYLDAAERYDRASLVGWAMAQVSFVALLYFLTREQKRTLIPAEGEPLVRPKADGVELGVKVAP